MRSCLVRVQLDDAQDVVQVGPAVVLPELVQDGAENLGLLVPAGLPIYAEL